MTGYNIVPYVRQITDLETDDITDGKLEQLSLIAWRDLQSKVGVRVTLEKVEYIDSTRKNTIDGSNTVFFTKNSYNRYMGDYDGDMALGTGDCEVWLIADNVEDKTEATVSAVASDGKITLTTVPTTSQDIYLNYIHLPLQFSPLDPLLRDATAYLTGAMAYGKLEARDYAKVGFRGLNIVRMPQGYSNFLAKYESKVREIASQDPTGLIKRTEDTPRQQYLGVEDTYSRKKY